MTKWFNYGICVKQSKTRSEIVDALEDIGLKVYGNGEDGVKATANAREVETDAVESALRPYFDSITGVIRVTANDTSDTASGTILTVEDGSLEVADTDHSGGQDSRYNWYGMMHNGLRVNGGKYY